MIDQRLLDKLPPAAADKLISIDGAAHDADDTARALQARAGLRDPREAARLQKVIDGHRQRAVTLLRLANAAQQWLQGLKPDVTVVTVPAVAVALRPNETALAGLERIRDEITAATNHLRVIKSAPLPKADLYKLIPDQVAALADLARPRITGSQALKIDFIDKRADFGITAPYAVGLLAWLDPDALTRRLQAEVEALPEAAAPMPEAERRLRQSELMIRIADLNRQEESLIENAQANGVELGRRADAEPWAVLNVGTVTKAAVAA